MIKIFYGSMKNWKAGDSLKEADDCILKVITVNEAYLRKLPYAAQTYAGVSAD